MSSTRYVSRHGSPRRGPLQRLGSLSSSVGSHGTRAAAKTVAGVGIVLGSGAFVIAPSQAADDAQPSDLAAVSFATDVSELLTDRAGQPASSRSTARTAAAVTAPKGGSSQDVHDSAGALALDPVVKPKPKPKPVEEPAAPEQATRSNERSEVGAQEANEAESQGGSVQTGNYASQGAALGLGPSAQRVYSAVRTQFPDMTSIGGYRAGDPGDHGSGNAVDIMVTGARGDQVASWLQANAGQLSIKYIIWEQRIWMPGGSWRMMSDRGSATQNHYDHVHVSVN